MTAPLSGIHRAGDRFRRQPDQQRRLADLDYPDQPGARCASPCPNVMPPRSDGQDRPMTGISSDQADDAEQVAHLGVCPTAASMPSTAISISLPPPSIHAPASVSARAVFPIADGEPCCSGQFVRIVRMETVGTGQCVFRVPQQAVNPRDLKGHGSSLSTTTTRLRSSNSRARRYPGRGEQCGAVRTRRRWLASLSASLNNLNDGMTVDPEPTEAQ